MNGKNDEKHLKCAIINNATILTNDKSFVRNSKSNKVNHNGILILYKDNNPKKDMKLNQITKCINNIEKDKIDLKNNSYPLNSFNY